MHPPARCLYPRKKGTLQAEISLFFPFKFFEISDLYCLGEYLRAHRKLTCDIYRLNSACSIYWTWKSCRNKLQHGKWTEEDGRHQFHFRWIMKKFMRLTFTLIDLRGNQQMNSLNAQFITGHKGAALHDKSTLWFISKAKWWHWTGNTNVTGYQLGMRPSDHIFFFWLKMHQNDALHGPPTYLFAL